MEREPHEILGVPRFAPWPDVRTAFRALARRYHPDGTAPDPRRMAALNAAYAALEQERRASRSERPAVPTSPGAGAAGTAGTAGAAVASPVSPPGPPVGSLLWRVQQARRVDSPVLDFGQYAGWRIADVAAHDRRYLVWLSRHSSGVRYRRAIEEVLGASPELGRRAAVLA